MGFLEDIAQQRVVFEASDVGEENWKSLGDFYDEIARDLTEDEEAGFYSVVSHCGEDVSAFREGNTVEVFGYSDLVRHSGNILAFQDPELGYQIALTQYDIEKKNGVRLASAIDALIP